MDFSAVVTDLDGTFWSTAMTLHSATIEAVERIDQAKLPFVIATGRRAQSTLGGMIPLQMTERPCILMNGALVRDRLVDPSFHKDSIPQDDALQTISIFGEHGLEPLVYIDHPEEDVLAGPNVAAGESYLSVAPGINHVPALDAAVAASDVIGFGAFGYTKDLLESIQGQIIDAGLASAIISPSHYEGDHGIMVQGSGVDKATGLDAYCLRHGLDRSRLVAVGDGFNDVGMLESAAVAIVPTNAPAEVQALADVLIAPNEEGGWAQIPEILGL